MTQWRTPETAGTNETVREDELVAADDSIIGRAFAWSMAACVIIALLIGGMVLMLRRTTPDVVQQARAFVPPRTMHANTATPVLPFEDITMKAGIDFVHRNGATGDKLLPETMGGGVAFLDFDNDGDQDLLLINSSNWPDAAILDSSPPTHGFYRNDGDGTFTNVTVGSGLDFSCYGMGVATGDFDHDGFVDVFISCLGPNHLLRNKGDGTFENVTHAANVAGADDAWSTSAAFFDYDRDGLLDLFVCNYVKWSREIDFAVNYTLTGVGRAYGPPNNFEGTHCSLYRNDGHGGFTDVSAAAGIQIKGVQGQPMAKALGVAVLDLDGDGWLDVIVANDTVQNFAFHNQKNGTFKECASEIGLAFDRNGLATGAMGIDAAHYRHDETLGVAIGNFANEMSSFYVSLPHTMLFTDDAIPEGIGAPTRLRLTFGVFFFDADLDGRLDLLHANGHIEDQINTVQSSQHYRQAAQVFWNGGHSSRPGFVEVPAYQLGDAATPIVGRGAAFADIDNDGDLDVALTQVNGPPLLLRNNQQTGHHWLRIRLIGNGTSTSRDATGAQIQLISGGVTQHRVIMPARSYLSQVEAVATFGLGHADTIESLKVVWPDGSETVVQPPVLNQTLLIRQP